MNCDHNILPYFHLGSLISECEEEKNKIPPDELIWPAVGIKPWIYSCSKCGSIFKEDFNNWKTIRELREETLIKE